MATTDIILLLLAVGACALGAWRGAVRQIGVVVAFVLAILVCRGFGAEVAGMVLPTSVAADEAMRWAIYVVLFVVVFVAVVLLARLVHATFSVAHMGLLDRMAGAILQLGIWLVAGSVLLNIYFMVVPPDKERFTDGKPWRTLVVEAAPTLMGHIAASAEQ